MKQINSLANFSIYHKLICSISLVLLITNISVMAQDELNVIQGESSNNRWLQFSDAPNSLYHHLAGQAFELLENRTDIISGLNTLSDWQQRQDEVRKILLDIIGPFPEKSPLNAKVTGIIEKDGYRVEHIVFESQPEFYVTGSLFIPNGLTRKLPAVIVCSGHQVVSYRGGSQHRILNFVKKGFIVFAFDPVGQGERIEYYDPATGSSIVGSSTREHSYPGAQAFITGSSQARHMIWDGIRSVDYLLTREEVDSLRIGITGGSGGGTQSAYIAAFDERIYAAAPGNYITNFTRLLQSIGPQDAEQNLLHGIKQGIDHADLLSVRAPKPTLIYATTRDFFSIQGTMETNKELEALYKVYDKPDFFEISIDDAGHATTKKNREAIYAFFQKHLNNPGNPDEQEVEILNEEEIQVTSTGQVSTSLGGESVFSLNRREAKKLINELQYSRIDLNSHLPDVLASAKALSGYQEPTEADEPVFTGRIQRDGYVIEKYFVKGEGDYIIPYLLMIPEKPNDKSLLYLHPSGKSAEAAEAGEMEWFVRNGFRVLAPDLVGIGETGPGDFRGDANIEGESYNMWFASVLIGRSIVGIRAGDVVRLTRLLKRNPEIDRIYGLAWQEMGPVLLHAAAFDQSISRIALVETYSSYQSIVMNRFYAPKFIHSTVAGSLESYDLADLAAALAPRKLLMVDVTDGTGNMKDVDSINKDMSVIHTVYQNGNAGDQLTIITRGVAENLYDLFLVWIE